MSEFDLVVIFLLAVSGLIGCLRGATREVMTVLAFVLGAFAALYGLKYTGPLFRHAVHPAWAANGLAMLVTFVIVYLVVRIVAARLTHTVRHMEGVSLADRVLGAGFGVVRGLVLLGAFQLLLSAALPGDRTPGWIANTKLYPLAVDSGRTLALLAPQGSAMAKSLAPTVERAVAENPASPTSDQRQEKPQ